MALKSLSYCGNQSTRHLVSNPSFHEWKKYVELDLHIVWETSTTIISPPSNLIITKLQFCLQNLVSAAHSQYFERSERI
jgi:hypothetical protein